MSLYLYAVIQSHAKSERYTTASEKQLTQSLKFVN
jgi:hypothetical protein